MFHPVVQMHNHRSWPSSLRLVSPLHLAAGYNNLEVAEYLLEQGADVNVRRMNNSHHDETAMDLLIIAKKERPLWDMFMTRYCEAPWTEHTRGPHWRDHFRRRW